MAKPARTWVLGLLLCVGCAPLYEYPAYGRFGVHDRGDLGPTIGSRIAPNARVMEWVIARPPSPVQAYYALALAGPLGNSWGSKNLQADLNHLRRRAEQLASQEGRPPVGRHYASAMAELVAPHVRTAVRKEGFARIVWGWRLENGPHGPHLARVRSEYVLYVLTAPQENRISLLFEPADDLPPSQWPRVDYDVSAIDGAWDENQDLDPSVVKDNLRVVRDTTTTSIN